jgi:predicted alpha/beta superfamily hydrolase
LTPATTAIHNTSNTVVFELNPHPRIPNIGQSSEMTFEIQGKKVDYIPWNKMPLREHSLDFVGGGAAPHHSSN